MKKEETSVEDILRDEVCPRIEKYPDLPEDEFIPIEYTHKKKGLVNVDPDYIYLINKKGEIKNKKTNKIIKSHYSGRKEYIRYLAVTIRLGKRIKLTAKVHILVASTFLKNKDPDKFKFVNHLDHNPINNCLFNLEYITRIGNSNCKTGKHLLVDEKLLTIYVGYDKITGEEKIRFNRRNIPSNYIKSSIGTINQCIKNGWTYKGMVWKTENNLINRDKNFFSKIGYSGNINDYTWLKHPLYENIYVCEEGYILSRFKTKNNKIKENLLGSISSGYIFVDVKVNGKKRGIAAHRIIIEFLLNRFLKEDEIVDHINTNTLDNSFSNLRLTDHKGNMNNENTLKKYKKKFIVANLFGDILKENIESGEVYEYIYGYYPKDLSYTGKLTMNDRILNNKYICFHVGSEVDLNILKNRLSRVYYVIDKSSNVILKACLSYTELSKLELFNGISYDAIRYRFTKKLPIKENIYIEKGISKIDNILLNTNHLNILNKISTKKDTNNN